MFIKTRVHVPLWSPKQQISFYWVKKCNFLVGVILIIDYHSPLSLLATPPPLPHAILSSHCPSKYYLPSRALSCCTFPLLNPPCATFPPSFPPCGPSWATLPLTLCACLWATFSSKLQLILASVRVSTVPIFLVRSITLGFSLIWILLINVSVKWTKQLLWIHLICQIIKIYVYNN